MKSTVGCRSSTNRPICLATDYSRTGIGFWLLQKHCLCPSMKSFCYRDGWLVTQVGSRFTHAVESRYAPVEGEALAVADALNKARYFVLRCKDLIVTVDHKPLFKIFDDCCLENIHNPRLRNLKKTLRYKFHMVHIPGMKHRAADCISRHPTDTPKKIPLIDDIANVNTSPVQTVTWVQLHIASSSDPDFHQLTWVIEAGFLDRHEAWPVTSFRDLSHREDLHTVDDHLLQGLHRHSTGAPPRDHARPSLSTPKGHVYDQPGRTVCLLATYPPFHQRCSFILLLVQL
jgi:hypothetical protein